MTAITIIISTIVYLILIFLVGYVQINWIDLDEIPNWMKTKKRKIREVEDRLDRKGLAV